MNKSNTSLQSRRIRLDGCIFVAGHRGLAGSAILRRLRSSGYENIVTATRQELDLTDALAVQDFFAEYRPEYVFLAAAKVGGIWANNEFPADFIRDNLAIQSNVIESAYRYGVRKLLFLGSSCIYPKLASQPMREDALLTGLLEPTNEAYAIAKITGIKTCAAYNRQYGTQFISLMPTNLYGPNDNYDLEHGHALPALIRKAHEAKKAGQKELVVWGSGAPRREFMHSDDLASACVFAMEHLSPADIGEFVNVGVGEDITIRELAELIADIVGFNGELVFDTRKPDGTPRKLLDVSLMKFLGWSAHIDLRTGIEDAYRDYLARFDAVGSHLKKAFESAN